KYKEFLLAQQKQIKKRAKEPKTSYVERQNVFVFVFSMAITSLLDTVFSRRKKKPNDFISILEFDFDTIRVATKRLSDLIGRGGFGFVYKGRLKSGEDIAVKRLSRSSTRSERDFRNELEILSKLRHKNLIHLLGFCSERDQHYLVYEFMPNSTLDCFISDPCRASQLNWKMCKDIVEGIARGLRYLHEESGLWIVHRDIKPKNILLDSYFKPKITGFELARTMQQGGNEAETTGVAGTIGYLDPEYLRTGRVSVKSDVYAFGVTILTIISRRRAYSSAEEPLIGYVMGCWNRGEAIDVIHEEMREEEGEDSISEILRYIHIALLCVDENAQTRPIVSLLFYLNQQLVIDFLERKKPISLGHSSNHPRLHKHCLRLRLLLFSMAITSLLDIVLRRRKKKSTELITTGFKNIFVYDTIRTATDEFSHQIAQDQYGSVYKGKLESGQEISVRIVLPRYQIEFLDEINLLSKLRHKNLIHLLGFCSERDQNFLIYEFMPNSSLGGLIFDPNRDSHLSWEMCRNIIEGIARGLRYLHEESGLRVVHLNINPTNILLDADLEPKIAGFRFARLIQEDENEGESSNLMGTVRFIAPEYHQTLRFSVKCDVYCFGVTILTIIRGRSADSFGHLDPIGDVRTCWKSGEAIDVIHEVMREVETEDSIREILRYIHIALLCVNDNPETRPSLDKVLHWFSCFSTPLPEPTFGNRFLGEEETNQSLSPSLSPGHSSLMSPVSAR
ncbi:unnamed protein product, partial [Thlaspi arvense]